MSNNKLIQAGYIYEWGSTPTMLLYKLIILCKNLVHLHMHPSCNLLQLHLCVRAANAELSAAYLSQAQRVHVRIHPPFMNGLIARATAKTKFVRKNIDLYTEDLSVTSAQWCTTHPHIPSLVQPRDGTIRSSPMCPHLRAGHM